MKLESLVKVKELNFMWRLGSILVINYLTSKDSDWNKFLQFMSWLGNIMVVVFKASDGRTFLQIVWCLGKRLGIDFLASKVSDGNKFPHDVSREPYHFMEVFECIATC